MTICILLYGRTESYFKIHSLCNKEQGEKKRIGKCQTCYTLSTFCFIMEHDFEGKKVIQKV